MATPDGNSVPKNYIVSAINKKLLTPCRRVGLSRTKKTPKNIIQEIPIRQEETTDAPVNANKLAVVKRQDLNFSNTPKGCSNPKLGQSKVETASFNVNKSSLGKNQNLDFDITPKQGSNPKLDRSQVKTPHRKNIERIKNDTPQSYLQCTNSFETPKKNNQDMNIEGKLHSKEVNFPNDINTETLGKISPGNIKDSESDSPPASPLFTKVAVQVHSFAAKRSINFSEAQVSVETEKHTGDHKLVCSSESEHEENSASSDSLPLKKRTLPEPLNVSATESRKRKFRLDSDDFENIEDDISSGLENSRICRSVKDKFKSNVNMSTGCGTLKQFTTEDYLEEYFTNPKAFQDSLDIPSSTLSDPDKDEFVEFMPGNQFKNRKLKSKEVKEKQAHKNYVAVLCSSIEISGTENIQDLKKSSKTESIKKELTVSLERMNSIGKKGKQKNPDFKKLDSILMEKKKIVSQISDSDDEMFTSSPESDRKQRANLLQLITEMEKEVKQKEETLERLKRAQLYKKIHSPEKLNKSSEKWTEGCKSGLRDLLIKMQEHGPMEMDNLIRKLRIPDCICKKLNL